MKQVALIVAAIGAWLLLDGKRTTIQAAGGALVLLAAFIGSRPSRKNAAVADSGA